MSIQPFRPKQYLQFSAKFDCLQLYMAQMSSGVRDSVHFRYQENDDERQEGSEEKQPRKGRPKSASAISSPLIRNPLLSLNLRHQSQTSITLPNDLSPAEFVFEQSRRISNLTTQTLLPAPRTNQELLELKQKYKFDYLKKGNGVRRALEVDREVGQLLPAATSTQQTASQHLSSYIRKRQEEDLLFQEDIRLEQANNLLLLQRCIVESNEFALLLKRPVSYDYLGVLQHVQKKSSSKRNGQHARMISLERFQNEHQALLNEYKLTLRRNNSSYSQPADSNKVNGMQSRPKSASSVVQQQSQASLTAIAANSNKQQQQPMKKAGLPVTKTKKAAARSSGDTSSTPSSPTAAAGNHNKDNPVSDPNSLGNHSSFGGIVGSLVFIKKLSQKASKNKQQQQQQSSSSRQVTFGGDDEEDDEVEDNKPYHHRQQQQLTTAGGHSHHHGEGSHQQQHHSKAAGDHSPLHVYKASDLQEELARRKQVMRLQQMILVDFTKEEKKIAEQMQEIQAKGWNLFYS